MEMTARDDMTALVCECLSELDVAEAKFIELYYLADTRTTVTVFGKEHGLSPKQLAALRTRAMSGPGESLAARNVQTMGDIS